MNKIITISILFITLNSFAQKTGIFLDKRDNKIYPLVQIDTLVWMAENLNADKFRNGDLIPEAKTLDEWKKACENGEPAWCYYENRSFQPDSENGKKYGKLYNWHAVIDTRGLAPEGWHISSEQEWKSLVNFLGGFENAAKKLKSKSGWAKKHFNGKPGDGDNKSRFNGLPGGLRTLDGSFILMGNESVWWVKLEPTLLLWTSSFKDCCDYVEQGKGFESMGCSVRCVKD
jgi:uncharacterized protein (TIGR02145 family)